MNKNMMRVSSTGGGNEGKNGQKARSYPSSPPQRHGCHFGEPEIVVPDPSETPFVTFPALKFMTLRDGWMEVNRSKLHTTITCGRLYDSVVTNDTVALGLDIL